MQIGLIKNTALEEKPLLVDVRFTHSLCIGQTGSGKTSSFIYPNLAHRLSLGHAILFFDIKGNEHKAIKKLAKDAGRLADVIEIGKPWGKNINILTDFNSRTFSTLLKKIIKMPLDGGSNSYFYNAAFSLGMSIFEIIKACSIISQEIHELKIEQTFAKNDYTVFTINDIYKASFHIDALYDFLQDRKRFAAEVFALLQANTQLYLDPDKQDLFQNIAINYSLLQNLLGELKKYDVPEKERSQVGKFEPSLLAVISTLSEGFGFMVSPSGSYISEKKNPIDIVECLQDAKIIIINVRVIPDSILELLLEHMFEKMIDLNLLCEEKRHPTSIFIDEAQRLVNKDIPLDILRSSKVDVIMAVQSELQLMSKFQSETDWQQISVNISEKYAFRSAFLGGSHLISFYAETGNLQTFEYVKEFSTVKRLAQPVFLTKDDLEAAEMEYQHKVLQLDELKENEIYQYDVTHFESEREIIVFDTKTKRKHHKKLFTQMQKEHVYSMFKEHIPLNPDELYKEIKDTQLPSKRTFNKICKKLSLKTVHQYKNSYAHLCLSYAILCNELLNGYENFWNIVFEEESEAVQSWLLELLQKASADVTFNLLINEKDDENEEEDYVDENTIEVVSMTSSVIKAALVEKLEGFGLQIYEDNNGLIFIFLTKYLLDKKQLFEDNGFSF